MFWLTENWASLRKWASGSVKWSFVRKLQNDGLLKATLIWFAVVPVLARLLSRLKDEITFEIGGERLTFPLDLPFSWTFLYFASLAFIFSSILYRMFAPAIIRENADYGEFERSGKSNKYIVAYMRDDNKAQLLNRFSNKLYGPSKKGQEIFQVFYLNVPIMPTMPRDKPTSSQIRNRRVAVFEHVFEARDTEKIFTIWLSLFFLAMAAFLSLIVASQHVWYVLVYISNHGIF